MKSLSAHVAIILVMVGVMVLVHVEVCWADWIFFDKTEDADFYFDKDDITHSSARMATVWTKHVYTKKGVTDMVNMLGIRFENLDHSINLYEFDCLGKMVLSLSSVYFSNNGAVLEIKQSDHEWKFLSSGSMFDVLCGKVCKR